MYKTTLVYEDGKVEELDGKDHQLSNTKVLAKKIVNVDEETTQYFIKANGGSPYNPLNSINTSYRKERWRLVKANEKAYSLYFSFLVQKPGNTNWHRERILERIARELTQPTGEMKMAKVVLTEADKFYINSNRDKTAEDLATAVGKKVELVEQYIKDNPVKAEHKPSRFEKNIIKKQQADVTVAMAMTQANSQYMDDNPPATRVSDYSKCIHRPKG